MFSEIVLFDIDTGAEEVLYATDRHVEAPNWAPDGGHLVVNSGGRLYRLAFDAPEVLVEIDTGACTGCNNDHGISPDGQWLAISDHAVAGASCIFVLPASGGAPRRVTAQVPSYWHGWSPDGTTLTYTAKREGVFNIFTIPVAGGEETQVTFGAGHKDGPDYTPDGRWIWFNSDHHGGGAELWRVPSDGGAAERMTDEASVNWFPHPSPDGAHVLYLAYPEGTEGHPADLPVSLRLMPAEGGASRVLTSFTGGQGSINVPCWAPDSRRFAYVRYTPPLAPAEVIPHSGADTERD